MSKFLPCPFCGSADINTEGPCYTQFMCNDCGASTYDQSTRKEAIAAWNKRAPQASDVNMEMLEALQAQELLASLRMPGDIEQNIIKVREMRRAAINKAEGRP